MRALTAVVQPLLLALRDGSPEVRADAVRRAYRLAFGVLAAPGVVFGVAYALLGGPSPLPGVVVAGLALLAAGVAGGALWLAGRTALDPQVPAAQALVGAAIQAGSAPAVPFLFGCSLLAQPLAALALFVVAAGFFTWGHRQLPRFAR